MTRRAELDERKPGVQPETQLKQFQAQLAAELSANYAGFRAWDAGSERMQDENWAVQAAGWYRTPKAQSVSAASAATAAGKQVTGAIFNRSTQGGFLSCLLRRLERNYATFFSWTNF